MSNLYKGPVIDASYQVSVHLAKRFQRRRFSKSTIQKQELPMAPMFVDRSELKTYFHNIEFHKEQFLLGFKEESLTLNLLILIAKNYIYKCKLKEKISNIIKLKYRIKNYYSLEQYIAINNNNLKGFEKYWTPVKHVFPDF